MPAQSPETGMRISEYLLEERVGEGGFGEVWRARHHLWSDTVVAIKFPSEPGRVREIANEGILQHQLDHPNIVKTLGVDPAHDIPYVIGEFVPGSSLRQILNREGKLSLSRALGVFRQLLNALEHAHQRGVVHLDVKPGNVLITKDELVKLGDFGVGRILGSGKPLALSGSLGTDDSLGGTLAYLSPEQRDGSSPADHRSDLYSTGIVLFEMLTGTMPQGAEFPRQLRPDLPEWVDRLFARLYTRVESRYGSAAEVLRDLAEHWGPMEPTAAEKAAAGAGPGGDGGKRDHPPGPKLLEAHARDRLGLSPRAFEDLCREGRLHPFTEAGVRYVQEGEVEAYERSRGREPGEDGPAGPGENSSAVGVTTEAPAAKVAGRAEPVPAGLFVRALAHGVDLVFLAWIIMLPALLPRVGGLEKVLGWLLPRGGGVQHMLLLGAALWLLYLTIAHAAFGRTLGKLAMGLRVVREDGPGRPGAICSILRTIGYVISFLPFPLIPLGFLWIPFSPRKRGLHDHMAGTVVIHS